MSSSAALLLLLLPLLADSAPLLRRVERGARETPPDIYLITPRNRTAMAMRKHLEVSANGTDYKVVDITDDIIRVGLNRNVHLTDYLENKTGNQLLKFVVRDRGDIQPFQYRLSPNRSVVFTVNNAKLAEHHRKERKDLLRLARVVDPNDDLALHKLMYRVSGALDDSEEERHQFMRKIIRNLARNEIAPRDLSIDQLERELADAEVVEFAYRQLRIPFDADLPYYEKRVRDSLAPNSFA